MYIFYDKHIQYSTQTLHITLLPRNTHDYPTNPGLILTSDTAK